MGIEVESEKAPMSRDCEKPAAKVKSEKISPFEGGENDKVVQGDDLGALLSKAISKFSRIISLQRGSFRHQILLLVAFLIVFSNCTDSFQALEENDKYHFSIYGFLDASADTQWVRVSPAREQVETSTDVPEMSVSIENLESGETIFLNDSLFQQRGVNYLNFWTTEKIEHNHTYRLTAERPDGAQSHVTVEIPGEIPAPLVIIQQFFGQPTTYLVLVDDNLHVADVQSKWYVRLHTPNFDVQRVFSFAYRNTAETTDAYGGAYSYLLEPEKELEEIEREVLLPADGEIEVVHRQIYVASSGSEWSSSIASLDDITYALPETFSNVENGVGFLTGIDSKFVPYASCENEEKSRIIPCPEEEAFW